MTRPRCRRCGAPLDLAWDGQTLRWEWECRPGEGPAPDDHFADVWLNLPEEEAARLEAEAAAREE